MERTQTQHILITGGNAGIGKATAKALAKRDHHIILACRDMSKADQAVEELKQATGNHKIYRIHCDLSSLDSVRTCVQTFKKEFGKLDILINNAGVVTDKRQFTQDGFELQIGVNHLGHFLLTTELLDLLQASKQPRIINVSSNAHYRANIHVNSFKGEIGPDKFKGMAAYGQSKLANVLFTKELARRYPSICSHSLHPGVVRTNIANKNENGFAWSFMWSLFKPLMMSVDKGAKTSIYLAQSPEALRTNGGYFHKQKEIQPSELANDQQLAEELWAVSLQLVSGV